MAADGAAIYHDRLDNGLHLVAERVPGVRSVAVSLLVPVGVAAEPQARGGAAAVLSEMVFRGAGDLSARDHADALDRLGVHRSAHAGTHHLHLTAVMLGENLADAAPLLLDAARRPTLGEDAFTAARQLAVQELDALDDNPQDRAMIELSARHHPIPFGRPACGDRAGLAALTADDIRGFHAAAAVPEGSILSFAGDVDFDALRALVTGGPADISDWAGRTDEPTEAAAPPRGYHHVETDASQTHIALAYDAPARPHPDAATQRAAVAVLSGGMSGRLFTEVREKRGLCYAVMARYAGSRDRGAVVAYAGTAGERAQETLDVLAGELRRLTDGADAAEFDRAMVGMRSRVVMQGESTSARAAALANDLYTLGRPRSLDEMRAEVESVTLDKLNTYLAAHPPGEMTTVTIGPSGLNIGS